MGVIIGETSLVSLIHIVEGGMYDGLHFKQFCLQELQILISFYLKFCNLFSLILFSQIYIYIPQSEIYKDTQ